MTFYLFFIYIIFSFTISLSLTHFFYDYFIKLYFSISFAFYIQYNLVSIYLDLILFSFSCFFN